MPQIILALSPSGDSVIAEAFGKNGSRRKLGAWPITRFPPELRAEFELQRAEDERARETRAATDARKRREDAERMFALAWERHGAALAELTAPELAAHYARQAAKAEPKPATFALGLGRISGEMEDL